MNAIFHCPRSLNSGAISASGLRPSAMRVALTKAVDKLYEITGDRSERVKNITKVKKFIDEGEKVGFIYFENLTQPNKWASGFNNRFKLPDIDINFLKYAKKRGVTIGYFYRDIYWMFPEYLRSMSIIRKSFFIHDAKSELETLAEIVDVLFLPSYEMAGYLKGYPFKRIAELPPGLIYRERIDKDNNGDCLNMIYVGGIGNHYRLDEILGGGGDNVNITIYGRKKEVSTLAPTSKHVFIEADIFGLELDEKYKEADIGLLYTEPSEYRTFAVPYKLFEYMSYRLPIIATSGTWAGNFVQDNNIGWVIPYNVKEFKALTKDLINNKEEVQSKRRNIEKILPMHTWESRARKVKHELAGNN